MVVDSPLRRLFGATCLTVLLLAGCATFPGPSSDKDSLFVLFSENPAPRTGAEGDRTPSTSMGRRPSEYA